MKNPAAVGATAGLMGQTAQSLADLPSNSQRAHLGANMADTAYERAARIKRLVWLEGEHSRAMYGWNHPDNIKWAETRQDRRRVDEIAELRRRVTELVAAKRHDVADEPEQSDVVDDRHDEQGSEPVVIRRRGGLHHAK